MNEKVLITKSKLDTLAKKIVSKTNSSGKKTIDELGELVDGIAMPETVEQATPTIEVDVNGKITASSTQMEGYVVEGTKSATKQLTTKGTTTYIPTTTDQTIPSKTYLTGIQTIKGDSNLIASNIKKDVTIFGVTGTLESGGGATQGDMLQTKVDKSKSCAYLFYDYIGTNVDFISNLDTSGVINMQSMFDGCYNLITIPTLDTSSVTNMRNMFDGCTQLTTTPQLDTSSATAISHMFYNCSRIYKIDISYFNISSTSYSGSFAQNCYSLQAVIIRDFGTNYVLNSTSFNKCYHILGTKNSTYNPTGAKDGYIYVPRSMIDTLSSATNWSTYASQLRALEDYTVDGTTTGAFDDTKVDLNGSTGGSTGGGTPSGGAGD